MRKLLLKVSQRLGFPPLKMAAPFFHLSQSIARLCLHLAYKGLPANKSLNTDAKEPRENLE
jgi:hypothetical protein